MLKNTVKIFLQIINFCKASAAHYLNLCSRSKIPVLLILLVSVCLYVGYLTFTKNIHHTTTTAKRKYEFVLNHRWYLSGSRFPGVINITNDTTGLATYLRGERVQLPSKVPVWPSQIFSKDFYDDAWNFFDSTVHVESVRNNNTMSSSWPVSNYSAWLTDDNNSNNITDATERLQQKPFVVRPKTPTSSRILPDDASVDDGILRAYHDRIEFQMLANMQNETFSQQIQQRPTPKRILLTSSHWWWGANTQELRGTLFDSCPINRCEARVPEELHSNVTHESCDAVLTHSLPLLPLVRDTNSSKMVRPAYSLRQHWIYYALESPWYNRLNSGDGHYDAMINWTATYRFDSDLVAPYNKWTSYANLQKVPLTPAVKEARNMWSQKQDNEQVHVLALISNCGAVGRLKFAKQLSEAAGVKVDIFGSCGVRTPESGRNQNDEFLEQAKTKYHFYLAFENSRCRSYITEKYYSTGLGAGMIPIVRGATKIDYKLASPSGAFIFADDFKTAGALAKYLKFVVHNRDLYNSYFSWVGTGEFMQTNFWCRLCSMLWYHDLNQQPNSWYTSILHWWEGSPDDGTEVCMDEKAERWTRTPKVVNYLSEYRRYGAHGPRFPTNDVLNQNNSVVQQS